MSYFEFPHTRTYDSDLGWLIMSTARLLEDTGALNAWRGTHEAEYKDLLAKVDGLVNSLIDVIVPWDSSLAYHIYSMVEYQGQNYIALQDVPVGVMITNTDYWQPANTIVEQINAISLSVESIKENLNFVTPEMFGAVGDGVTDDAGAIQAAINTNQSVRFGQKVYAIGSPIVVDESNTDTETRRVIDFGEATIKPLDTIDELVRVTGAAEGFAIKGGHFTCDNLADYGIHFINTIYGTYIIEVFVEDAVIAGIQIEAGHHNWIINSKIFNKNTFATGISTRAVDTKITGCEIYYTNNAIISGGNIIVITNCHLWAGGVLNETEETYGIKWYSDTTANTLLAADVYIDSFKYGVYSDIEAHLAMSSCLFYIANTTTANDCIGIQFPNNNRNSYRADSCIYSAASGKTITPAVKGGVSIPLYSGQVSLIDDSVTSLQNYADTLPVGRYTLFITNNTQATDAPPFQTHKIGFIEVFKYSQASVKMIAVSCYNSSQYTKGKYNNTWDSTWKLVNQSIQDNVDKLLNPSGAPITIDLDNDNQESGYYRLSSSSTGLPESANGLLERTKFSDTVIWDRFITSSGKCYERVKWSTWQPWTQTSNN